MRNSLAWATNLTAD